MAVNFGTLFIHNEIHVTNQQKVNFFADTLSDVHSAMFNDQFARQVTNRHLTLRLGSDERAIAQPSEHLIMADSTVL